MILNASTDERGLTYPFIAPTRVDAKEIAWDDHVAAVLNTLNKAGMRENIHYDINKSDLSIAFRGYGKFMLDGADNIESLRGKSNWGGVALDEFATWRNSRISWEEVIEPNLIVNKAWSIFAGTPKGYNYFHTLAKKGDHKNEIEGDAMNEEGELIKPNNEFLTYRYTSYDNLYLDKDWLERKKASITESSFNQEYLARFETYTGLVFKEFNRSFHVVNDIELDGYSSYYRSMDFGATNPTAVEFIKVDKDDVWWIYDEYHETEKTTDYNAGQILAKYPQTRFIATFGDPSGKQQRLDYARWGLHITPATKEVIDGSTGKQVRPNDGDWIRYRIEQIKQRLKINPVTGKPRLFIHSRCVNTIREFEAYRWLERKDQALNEPDIPVKADDHHMDALGYFVVSYRKSQGKQFRQPPRQFVNPATGY